MVLKRVRLEGRPEHDEAIIREGGDGCETCTTMRLTALTNETLTVTRTARSHSVNHWRVSLCGGKKRKEWFVFDGFMCELMKWSNTFILGLCRSIFFFLAHNFSTKKKRMLIGLFRLS